MNSRSFGGCHGKVDSTRLIGMLTLAGLDVTSEADFVDAQEFELPLGVRGVATSVDLVYEFGLEPELFGWVGVVHALSDLYATLAQPLSATICLGVRNAQLSDQSAARTLSGARAALDAEGVLLGGGHTVYSDIAFIGVSAVGTVDGSELKLVPGIEYDLLLTKPLGIGIYISALRNGLLGARQLAELSALLKESNARASLLLKSLTAFDPQAVGFVTDVTGYGLANCLLGRVPGGWLATVARTEIPTMIEVRSLLETHGLSTGLGDSNRLRASELHIDWNALTMVEQLIVSDPQTSGGLLTAVSSEFRDEVKYSAAGLKRIGQLKGANDAPGHVRFV